ncbi:MAG: hypothetical protein COX96_00595 [Candidatus Omnitrophica bacterium CG_4_10_14_0_2_um_filter_44_9]|nr:MAG: hypothetical protein COY78_00750 [Candidatus Omnitrophica bacterium CG_4_10_14_0_8_um_filter_44_12]PIZ85072.1 MAG: hypothetical protein COX96_00595 [Candidatus Omnitrophica bacterium CG_4_10_14_0_2_um_filter_44_9]
MMNIISKLDMLHRVGFQSKRPKIFSFHDCLPDVFSSYIELLIYKRYRILGAEELLERLGLAGGLRPDASAKSREAVLTFDDGRRNCWTVIFPLLKKYKVKASFFIIPSRVKETEEYFPNLEDYWNGRVSWENLYMSHRKQPYLTWNELKIMHESGLVDIFSHSLSHDVVNVSSRVLDFQHPGVYEMPVYFDEWFLASEPQLDSFWGAPIYERAWAPLVSNCYRPVKIADTVMNGFVKKNGGFLFFKKKEWRKTLFEYFQSVRRSFPPGHFKRLKSKEGARESVFESKRRIEAKLKNVCYFFSLPLYQGAKDCMPFLEEAGYKAVFSGPKQTTIKGQALPVLSRIPSFWIKFLSYF